MKRVISVFAVVFAAVSTVSLMYAPTASADGEQCGIRGGQLCAVLVGEGLYVNQVKATAGTPCRSATIYHFQFTAPGWSSSTHDSTDECSMYKLHAAVDSGWTSIERAFPDKSLVCARLWVKDGATYSKWGEQCVTLGA